MKNSFYIGDYVCLEPTSSPVNLVYVIKTFGVFVKEQGQVEVEAEIMTVEGYQYKDGRIVEKSTQTVNVLKLIHAPE